MLFNKKEKISYEVCSLSFCVETSKNNKLKCAGEKFGEYLLMTFLVCIS